MIHAIDHVLLHVSCFSFVEDWEQESKAAPVDRSTYFMGGMDGIFRRRVDKISLQFVMWIAYVATPWCVLTRNGKSSRSVIGFIIGCRREDLNFSF